jgi:peptide/nickel transport system substrate-binding protein
MKGNPDARARANIADVICAIRSLVVLALLAAGLLPVHAGDTPSPRPAHGIAMHGEPALPPDFARMPYVDPSATRGGRIVFAVQGTFDSLNPFIVRGAAAQGVSGLVIQSLLARSLDEPFTLYGLLARSVATDPERTQVVFGLDPEARFSDGVAVTARDVLFSFELLKTKGRPNHRSYYRKVAKAEALDPLTVRFDLTGANDRELPLILGLMPIMPAHATDAESFEQTSFRPPVGSGPYRVAQVDPGKSVTYARRPDYWAADKPVHRFHYNADEIRFDYFRDSNTMFEAFKAGLYDVRPEGDPTQWMTGYDFPAVADGRVVRDTIPIGLPKGMSGFVFNTRRALFADERVREALGLVFDFEWINKNLFFGVYRRSDSFFADSDLASTGRSADPRERELLAAFPGSVREDVLDGRWRPPVSDGSGRDRDAARRALELLTAAGYELRDEGLVSRRTGEAFDFEVMVSTREQERLALVYAQALRRIGVTMRVRLVDSVQYQRRRQRFEYDMIIASWPASPSPGNEQSFRWSQAAAGQEGSFNYAGVRSPAVDAMIRAMLAARSREDFVSAVRALDRVLLSGSYVVPLFYLPDQWIARRAEVRRPERTPLFGFAPDTLWRAGP